MASKQQVESLTEEVICPICLDFFTDPVSLDCEHNFCRSCITQYWEKEQRYFCPECREEFKKMILRGNRALVRLSEKARKLNPNPKSKKTKLRCNEHEEELKLFCETDRKLICLICRDAREHKSHNFMPIKEAVEIYKEQVRSSLTSLTERKSTILKLEQQQKRKILEIRDESRGLESHISSEFTKIHQSLAEKEQRLIGNLKEHEEKVVGLMEENLREIQESLISIEEAISTLQKQMEQKDDVIFLKEECCQKKRVGEDRTPVVADGALMLEEFMWPLPLPVWREMLDDIQPDSVTLDVETAAPWLEVSEDLKSVRRTQRLRSLLDTGRRFTVQACVLGSEGFSSGRHYWEVEVAGNRGWCVGVAAESVERKGVVSLRPESGVWSIERWDDGLNVMACPMSDHPAGPIPGRVGVYLSYESGTVSFYNGNIKSHLCTFAGNKFTEKLYPFFWIGDENQCLRICSGSTPADSRGTAAFQHRPESKRNDFRIGKWELLKMASTDQHGSWTDEVICRICLEYFTDPVTLPCQHNFCRSCITRFWKRKERNYCPECGEEFANRTLRINWVLTRLAEKARKRPLNLNKKESKLDCEEHDEELKLFCETDKTLICLVCRDAREHREHRFLPIKEAAKNYKNHFKSAIETLMKRQQAFREMEQQQKRKISGVREQSQNLRSHITFQFAELHQILTEKEQQLLRDLREEEERILKSMEKNFQEVQKTLNSIQEKISRLQEQMDEKDDVLFLKEEAYLRGRFGNEVEPMFVPECALQVEKFNRPFICTAWSASVDGIKTVAVTLDVETAGPKLEVLPDLKSVRYTGNWRNLPDSRKRFTGRSCVLGLEGFTSGRHYWEVDAAGCRRWGLGVVPESVERQARLELIPENGFWTIWRYDDYFYVNSSSQPCLLAGAIPQRVGIYLSYTSGSVSFYNVETKSHLYTFTGNKFTEKLYPLFWNGDENWLRSCSSPTLGL
ncbi:uncharacterized protein LOC134346441 [Mobula hypostoma]|uniref:uncharacterized protein LOC134346441 n=1 Tax=Mobula hypostoma TaxID=723540 RepID=UPI002FC34107